MQNPEASSAWQTRQAMNRIKGKNTAVSLTGFFESCNNNPVIITTVYKK